ncbi:hypothetical protein EV204_1302 [Tissierella praeacuta]|uniref:hypothetical protein n=1 Tax=Tissierella praeacuta TaxID=43131 RepID=UPI00105048BD|nr:hypothetical protein [Tissierella praeacuta]TCU64165.1 hypothetical protein EV204_1302 [Tissierella praeacuta]
MLNTATLGNLSIFGYAIIASIFTIIWFAVASILTKNDMRDVRISFFIISGISFIISIIIFKKLGANFLFLFFLIGGVQIVAYPIFWAIGQGDMYGNALILYLFFQTIISLLIYLYLNSKLHYFIFK